MTEKRDRKKVNQGPHKGKTTRTGSVSQKELTEIGCKLVQC